jgi:hypothetical protein
VVIKDGLTSVTVLLREPGPARTPAEGDLGINVSVDGESFRGRNTTVWIGRADWAAFLQNLRNLERSRQGQAQVEGMSPGEFQLAVFATGKSGRIVAEGWVGREYTGRAGTLRDRVSFSVELDPSRIAVLVAEAESLEKFE